MSDRLSVPDGLPALERGSHDCAEQGSCLMEYVSVIAGTYFSDHPDCTHPVLARLARLVNDRVGDEVRPELALLAPDLVNVHGCAHVVRPIVLDHVVAAGLVVAPRDAILHRLQEQVRSYRAGGWARRRWHSATLTANTSFALAHFTALLVKIDRESRDRLLVELLRDTVADVRAAIGREAEATATIPAPRSPALEFADVPRFADVPDFDGAPETGDAPLLPAPRVSPERLPA